VPFARGRPPVVAEGAVTQHAAGMTARWVQLGRRGSLPGQQRFCCVARRVGSPGGGCRARRSRGTAGPLRCGRWLAAAAII